MKKLLASLLAAAMALSLAAPAFADDPPAETSPGPDEGAVICPAPEESAGPGEEPPFDRTADAERSELAKRLGIPVETEDYKMDDDTWEWIAAHEKQTKEFLDSGMDAYLEKHGYGSLEEFGGELSQDGAKLYLLDCWILLEAAEREKIEDFEAAHPGMIAWFEANAYDYFAQEYTWWDSAEEYMKVYGYTEEEFVAEMVAEQIDILLYKEKQQAWLDQMKAELGGVPGQIGVMIDGEYVKFPDAAPELTGGRTMAPLRAVMEALGAKVAYNGNDDIRCTVDGVEYAFAVGSNAVKLRYVKWDGEGDAPDMEGLEMDCAPYIKGGRTYVPVRFFAEAFGYTVEWDGDFKTAVLIDYDKLTADIDKDFTILNKLLAGRELPDAYKASADCTGVLTIFNTIDGDTNSTMTVKTDLHTSPDGMSETLTYNLAALWDVMEREYGAELLNGTDEEQLATLKALLTGSMELRQDNASGMLYLSMPSLSGLLEQLGVEVPKDAWFSMDAGGLADKAAFENQSVTMGELLLLLTANTYYENNYYPVFSYSNVRTTAMSVATLLGDKQFTRKGDAVTLTIDKAKLEALAYELEIEDMPREFSFTLTVKDSGAVEYSLVYRTPVWDRYYGDSEDMRVTLSGSGSADGLNAEIKMELHVKNQYKLALTAKQNGSKTTEKPQTTPPEGAVVIPMDGADAYPGLDGLDPDFTVPT